MSSLVILDGLGYKQSARGRAPLVVTSEMVWPSAIGLFAVIKVGPCGRDFSCERESPT